MGAPGSPAYRFAMLELVRVKRPSRLKRPFKKRQSLFAGREGHVCLREIGKHSNQPLYTVGFADESLEAFFADELEAVAQPGVDEEAGRPLESVVVEPGVRSRHSALAERR